MVESREAAKKRQIKSFLKYKRWGYVNILIGLIKWEQLLVVQFLPVLLMLF